MTKRTKKAIILVLILLVVCLYFVSGTYARYASAITGNAKTSVATWSVAFKDDENAELSKNFNLTFTAEENANVVSGKIAPGTKLTATVFADLKGTEVAVECIADVEKDSLADIFGASADSVNVTTSVGGTTDGVISLVDNKAFDETNGIVEITISLEWENVEDNNGSDTEVGVAAEDITLPVTLTLQQYIDA